jgi:excisionase family DNA binding protein
MPRTSRPEVKHLVSVKDAAARCDVSTVTIRRWIADGALPAYRAGRRLVKIDLADLDRVIRRIPTVDHDGAV